MSKNLDLIEKAIPEAAEHDHIKAYAEDLDKAQLLRNVLESEGGEVLITGLREDAVSILTEILKEIKDPLVFKLQTRLDMLTTLQSAKDREKSLQEILDNEIRNITS